MQISSIIFVILLLILIGYFFFKKKRVNNKTDSAVDEVTEDLPEDFDKAYFEGLENGEEAQQFLVLGGQQDCALIRSLLAADNISTYVENENVNRMYGSTAAAVTGAFAIKLYILVKDYEKAYEIVCGYAQAKKEQSEMENENSDMGKVVATTTAAIVTGLFFSPVPIGTEQKYMGITILPKLEKNCPES